MKRLFIFFFVVAAVLAGCRSRKAEVSVASSVMNDSVAAIITEKSVENSEKSENSFFSSDSIGLRFSADSIRVGDVTIYGPVVMTEAKDVSLRQRSDERTISEDTVTARATSSFNLVDNRSTDLEAETTAGPTMGEVLDVVGFIMMLVITFVMFYLVIRIVFNRKR